MKWLYGLLMVLLLLLLAWIYISFVGDGKFERMTTFGGIYAVDEPSGWPVVCFIEKESNSMQCLPKAWIEGEQKPINIKEK